MFKKILSVVGLTAIAPVAIAVAAMKQGKEILDEIVDEIKDEN